MSVERWLARLSPGYAKVSRGVFARFLVWLGESTNLPTDPDALLAYQREHRGYDVLDAVQEWVSSDPEWTVAYKKVLYTTVRGFFLHNRAELPRDPSYRIRSVKAKSQGTLTVNEVRRLLSGFNPLYRAVTLCMVMGGMGVGEILHFSENGWQSLQAQLRANERFIRVNLPGRKKGRNVRPFYTFLGRDAIQALSCYVKARGWGDGPVFVNQVGEPLNEWAMRRYWMRHLVKHGLIQPEVLEGSKKYGVRYGKNPHELRDLFRTRWHMSGADATAAEFFMGHMVDPLEYNKAFMDVDYARGQYMVAEPWLNVVSEEPEKISRVDHELALRQMREAQDLKMEAMERRMRQIEERFRE